mmetsp:Transcript_52950/g.172328  ORF Transcript_52950/g.172328 Transcript_52950/m.172328 type:complete len:308 (+) Transcript_52950:186-1109(+)
MKGFWLPSCFGAHVTETWTKAGMASIDEFYGTTGGNLFKDYPKRCLFRTNGVHWDSDIEVVGAGIAECNGRYILDQKTVWRYAPVWHHEQGAVDEQWDGKGGGATILYDMVGDLGSGGGGEAYMLFYKGGARYKSSQLHSHLVTPTKEWTLIHEGHTWDGVKNQGTAPITRNPNGYSMEESLKDEAHAEAGYDELAGDVWLIDFDNQNWVVKRKPDPDAQPGGWLACCVPTAVLPEDSELVLLKNGVQVLDTITSAKLFSSNPLSVGIEFWGTGKGGRESFGFTMSSSGNDPAAAVQMAKNSRAYQP